MRRKKRRIKIIKNKKTDILGLRVPFIMLPILVFLGLVTVFLTIESVTLGAKLAILEEETRKLARENELLEGELVKASSLSNLGEKAEDMGFQKPGLVLYISKEEAVAKLP